MHKITWAVVALCAAAPSSLMATPITGQGSLPGGNPIYLPNADYVGSGPVSVGGGVTWSSNQSNSVYGWTGGYNTNTLVVAPGDPPIIGLNDANDASGGYATMTLTFATPTSGFLADIFWNNGFSNFNSTNMAIYDSGNNLLEYVLFNNNGNDIGMLSGYYGFSRAVADIAYVNFNNGYIGARDISYVGPAINAPNDGVPEPATWAMMLLGFGAMGWQLRRRRSSLALAQTA